jgi:hypothetical protein
MVLEGKTMVIANHEQLTHVHIDSTMDNVIVRDDKSKMYTYYARFLYFVLQETAIQQDSTWFNELRDVRTRLDVLFKRMFTYYVSPKFDIKQSKDQVLQILKLVALVNEPELHWFCINSNNSHNNNNNNKEKPLIKSMIKRC